MSTVVYKAVGYLTKEYVTLSMFIKWINSVKHHTSIGINMCINTWVNDKYGWEDSGLEEVIRVVGKITDPSLLGVIYNGLHNCAGRGNERFIARIDVEEKKGLKCKEPPRTIVRRQTGWCCLLVSDVGLQLSIGLLVDAIAKFWSRCDNTVDIFSRRVNGACLDYFFLGR